MTVNRRDLFRIGGKAALVAPMLSAASMAEAGKKRPEPLPPVRANDIITASSWNSIVDAVNELRAAS